VSLLGQMDVTLYRYPATTWGTDGRPVLGTAASSTIQATVQPMKGRDLEVLPEGDRQKRWIKLYSETEIKTGTQDDGAQRGADRIGVYGEIFEVQHVERQPAIIPHWKARAALLDEVTA